MTKTENTASTSWSIKIVLGLIMAAFYFANPQRFFESYHLGFLLWTGVALGSLGLLLMLNVVGARWGKSVEPFLFEAISTFPLLVLMFLPVLLGLSYIFPWANPEWVHSHPHIHHKEPYLNMPFFAARAILYFGCWIFLSRKLKSQSNLKTVSAVGLVVYFLTITFAMFDWGMSLEPLWFSSIYGAIHMVHFAMAALALGIFLKFSPSAEKDIPAERSHDTGNMLFAFVLLSAYMNFSQFLIIWYGNLPEEAIWYVNRSRSGWTAIFLLALAFQFVIPFFGLLIREVKRRPRLLRAFALLVVIGTVFAYLWYILPAFRPQGLSFHLFDFVTPTLLGIIWFRNRKAS